MLEAHRFPPHAAQRGAALLVFMLIGISAAFGLLLKRLGSLATAARDEATMQTLAIAKAALIGRAAADANLPGNLPCPEDTTLIGTINEGRARSSCPNDKPQVGRLPWRTLGLPDLRDDSGERLWYALSPGFRNAPINSDTPAQLAVDGVAGRAVAIIFAPGPALLAQKRPAPTDPAQYLDTGNGTGSFVSSGAPDQFNDRLTVVSAQDLFGTVEKRVGREVRLALLNYFCGLNNVAADGSCIAATGGKRFFPRPASFADITCLNPSSSTTNCNSGSGNTAGRIPANPAIAWSNTSLLRGTTGSAPNWFQVNGWRAHVHYAVAPACSDGSVDCNGSGTLTVNSPPGAPLPGRKFVVIVAGSALPSQSRSTTADRTSEANYLEDENAPPLDDVYTRHPADPAIPFNDQAFTLP